MPLTAKGNEIMSNMRSHYGTKKGTSVFYASRNKGTIAGVDPQSSGGASSRAARLRSAFDKMRAVK